MTVVAATSGSSMVASVPWAMQVGREREQPGRQGHRPRDRGFGELHAAVTMIATSQIQSAPSRTTGKSSR